MPPRQRIALTLPVASGSVAASIAFGQRAEREGYDDLWLADIGGTDALTLAALLGQATSRVRIGIAVVPAYTRTPAALACTAATIAQVAAGRFVLGIGSSSHTMIEGWHGLALDRPLTRLRETTQLLRQIFAGEKTAFDGKTLRSQGYRQPATPGGQPVYLAALRPQMLELAAEVGDGVILNLFPRRALPRIREHIAAGARRAGKAPDDVEVVCRHQVLVTDDAGAGREAFRRAFAPYYATPVYNQYLAWAGHAAAAAEISAGWAAGDRQRTAAAMTDALVDEIAIIGSREYCQERLRDYGCGGIHTHVLALLGNDAAAQDATYQAFTPANFRHA